MNRVAVEPELLSWALERSRKSYDAMEKRFPKLELWLAGKVHPTYRQLEDFATTTATPFGYFFLPEPPEEEIPIPDFRTLPDAEIRSPSADLLETLYTMQRRQAWLRETLEEEGAEPLVFVGSVRLDHDPMEAARQMRSAIGLEHGWARGVHTWQEAVGELRRAIEDLGIMAVINGVVANNTSRKLSVKEFRGFALCDEYAPLIFVNGADTKSAQIFTLAHELAHIWLGREGLSGFEGLFPGGGPVEDYCNRVAAEFLVPAKELRANWSEERLRDAPFEIVARHFKVSPIVAARRALDLRLVTRETFFAFYEDYRSRELHKKRAQSGGDFYNNQNTRVGEHFAMEVFRAAREGRLLYREAYRLTGLQGATFTKYARLLGFEA